MALKTCLVQAKEKGRLVNENSRNNIKYLFEMDPLIDYEMSADQEMFRLTSLTFL